MTPPSEQDAPATERRAELAASLALLREQVDRACADAGRRAEEITTIAITKTFPASDVRLLAELGVSDVGENRDQEAADKARDCADLPLAWHFVGQLQTNKARSVASYASAVHSVDRLRLVRALETAAAEAGRRLDCFLQVSLDPSEHRQDQSRGGADPSDVEKIATAVAAAAHLDLRGVMAVAPNGADPRPAFDRLSRISTVLIAQHPAATAISAGMSGDFEAAIAAGATHLRVGAALLGRRARTG